ncbi:MAG: penicillin acylase family protein, partial [Phaeodactylibacter sp.]|nr:penicillin acylase family protein [Phaeodactylibacter sp.]
EQQITGGDIQAYGVTVPGIPGIVIGFNRNVAWGMTNVSQDLVDWYHIDWANAEKTRYRIDGKEKAVEFQIDTIYIQGGNFVVDSIRWTDFGPIVYTNPEDSQVDLAMKWLVHEKPVTAGLRTFFGLNAAEDFDDYYRATADFETPPQNFVFAAKNGDIAMTVNGRFPIKAKEQGRFVQEGNNSNNGWKGFVSVEERPRIKNPAQGYVTSANQRSTDTTYPYYYDGHFDDFRGRIANRLLTRMDSITLEDMMAMQNSNYSIMAEEALPLLLAKLDTTQLNAIQMGLAKILRDWRYQFNKDLSAPILFDECWQAFYELLWDEVKAKEAQGPMLYPEIWRTIDFLAKDPLNVFWDIQATPERETPEMVVTLAFKQMFEKVRPLLDELDYNWGKHWTIDINHMANIPAFSVQNVQGGGYGEALNAIKKTSGPSWRMVVELGPEVHAYGIYPGGQSGNPGSPFYDQMIADWAAGKYYELFFMQDETDQRKPILQRVRFER